MKNFVLIIGISLFLLSANTVQAAMKVLRSTPCRVGISTNYPSNTINTYHNGYRMQRTYASGGVPVLITPKLPPEKRYLYKYREFAGERRFPKRSYYIPSYCTPGAGIYNGMHNPFCNHYQPFGVGIYLDY